MSVAQSGIALFDSAANAANANDISANLVAIQSNDSEILLLESETASNDSEILLLESTTSVLVVSMAAAESHLLVNDSEVSVLVVSVGIGASKVLILDSEMSAAEAEDLNRKSEIVATGAKMTQTVSVLSLNTSSYVVASTTGGTYNLALME